MKKINTLIALATVSLVCVSCASTLSHKQTSLRENVNEGDVGHSREGKDKPKIKSGVYCISDSGNEPVLLDMREYLAYTDDGLSVYAPKGHEHAHQEAVKFLRTMKQVIVDKIGIKIIPQYGICLHEEGEESVSIENADGRILIPIPIEHWEQKKENFSVNNVIIHEWVEISLIALNYPTLYSDKRSRYFGDGIAELAAYYFASEHGRPAMILRLDGYLDRLDRLLEKGMSEYRLKELFLYEQRGSAGGMPDPSDEMLAGYALSFWLFHDLESREGEGATKKILKTFSENSDKSLDGFESAYETVVGQELSTTINVAKARSDIQKIRDQLADKGDS